MSDEEEVVIVRKKVYKAALELLQAAADEKEDPASLAIRIISDCNKVKDEEAIKFWSEVQAFLLKTGVTTVEQLMPFSPSDVTH